MYHLKFYDEIRKIENGDCPSLLSGIFGDVWAGSIPFNKISSPIDCLSLGFTHGIIADQKSLVQEKTSNNDLEFFYNKHKHRINNHQYQVVTIARLKIMLTSYLLTAPTEFGFSPWSPFLDSELVRTMLFLPERLRRGRLWQRVFLEQEGLAIRHRAKPNETFNSLDFYENALNPLAPLDVKLLSTIVKPDYTAWINKTIQASPIQRFLHKPRVQMALMNTYRPKRWADWFAAYSAYLIIYPIESVLKKQLNRTDSKS
jgi:hypothetical protein